MYRDRYVIISLNSVGLQVVPVVKNLPANVGDTREAGSIPGLGRSSGVGNAPVFSEAMLLGSGGHRKSEPLGCAGKHPPLVCTPY